jgi:phytoene synthase
MPSFADYAVARADAAICAATLRQGSRSFAAAALLLPSAARAHARALYGFCREADDLIDSAPIADRPAAIASLRCRLDAACANTPHNTPVDRAFAAAMQACAIPRALPDSLLDGFAWDAESRRYATLPELRAYAARVAGTVGAMMALVLGARAPAALARACDLGVAMQLSNIARDIAEDARAGRLYLPTDWLEAANINPDTWLQSPTWSPAIADITTRLLTEAESLYASAERGIAALPFACRPAIRAAASLYREIGREVARRGPAAFTTRSIVSPTRKAPLILAALAPKLAHFLAAPPDTPALAETAYLVQAVPHRPPIIRENRVVWTLELFARLADRDQIRGLS